MSTILMRQLVPAPLVTATAISSSAIQVSCAPDYRAASYKWYRDQVFLVQTTDPTYTDTGLGSNETHAYSVGVVDANGQEGPHGARGSSATTLGDTTAPTAPGTLTFASVTSSSFIAQWTAAADNVAVAGYEYSLDGATAVNVGSTLAQPFTGLNAATSYQLRVRAYDAAGNRGPYLTATQTTSAGSGAVSATFVDISGSTSVSMFLAPLAGSFTYRVQYRIAGSGGAFTPYRSYYVPWAVVSGLATNTVYEFQYAGEDEDGNLNTAWSSTFTGSTVANEPDLPEAPRSLIYTKYSAPVGGTLWTATNTANNNAAGTGTLSATGCGFQYALDNCRKGDVIQLTAGATYVGPFNLRARPGTGWVYIQTSAYVALNAPRTRTGPAYATAMPKLVHTSFDTRVIHVEQTGNVSNYRFVGLEIVPQGTNSYGLVDFLHDSNGNQISSATPTTDIVLDRCYLHAETDGECGIGTISDGLRIAHIDCYYDDFKGSALPGFLNQTEAKSILFYGQRGPYLVRNCWLGAQGINIMFGGATPPTFSAADIPADIGVVGCDFKANQAYLTAPKQWQHKNLYEFKCGFRSVTYGCKFDTHWGQNQGAEWFLLTPRDQQYDPNGPWFPESQVTDLALVACHAKNVTGGMALAAGEGGDGVIRNIDGKHRYVATTKRVLVQHLLHEMTNPLNAGGSQFGIGYIFITDTNPGGIEDLIIQNWTLYNGVGLNGGVMQFYGSSSSAAKRNRFRYNIASLGSYGFHDQNNATTGNLNSNLANYFDLNVSFTGNILPDSANTGISAPASYPSGNNFPVNQSSVGFVNPVAGGDFRLSASSPYKGAGPGGRDPGCNVDLVPA